MLLVSLLEFFLWEGEVTLATNKLLLTLVARRQWMHKWQQSKKDASIVRIITSGSINHNWIIVFVADG